MKLNKYVKILSWNVNGLRAIERKKALDWIDYYNPNILCLQETKLSTTKFDHSNLFRRHFKSIMTNICSKKGFSGTITYSDYLFKMEKFCSQIDEFNEGRIIEQHFENIVLFNVYFPNGKLNNKRLKVKLDFYQKFLDYCISLKKKNKSIIICGDFNTAHKDIDLKKTKIYSKSGFSDIEREYFNKFIENNFIDTFRYINGDIDNAYTLFPYRSKAREKKEGWRIDYILISEDLKDKLKDAFILEDILGSDHCPIGIEIDLEGFI
ncbi:exodeoxyribonuclease III [Arcobacter sp. CECT 8989]|uniref:exodeoxyribonuclease III n=1 Tax=Arcobacter sp. CECT 8989 TaxID=2044509 RepID=UPI00100BDC2C|nr:exodeoxyribonuclease III [Arcobacter sp. CECT 8989]RXJ98126.1 exodeoxyribonuclease III [Arcobacter sp. CECT 8989]